MKYSLGISIFLEEISSLSHSVVILYVFALFTQGGFLTSPYCSLELCLQVSVSFLSPLLFTSLLSQLFVRPSQTIMLPFYISFSWGCFWSLPPVQCYEPPSIVLQALYQISALKSISHFHCIIIRDLIEVIPNGLAVFPVFFNLSLNLVIRSS